MNNKGKLTKPLYFTTTTVVDWVDIFTRPRYRHIVLESLAYCQANKGLNVYAWVLMSNHLHMIVDVSGECSLSDVFRDFKKYTSKRIFAELTADEHESRRPWLMHRFCFAASVSNRFKDFRFWQEGNYVEELWTLEFLQQKVNYIHMNPVRQEIVAQPEEYLYSSAVDYAGGQGLLGNVLVLR